MSDTINIFNLIEGWPPEKTAELKGFLVEYGRRKQFAKDSLIAKEDDPSEHIYIILDGIVEIIKRNQNGTDVVIAELGQGSIIGEMGVFLGKRRSASIRCKTDVVLTSFTPLSFLPALTKLPDLLLRLLRSFSIKLDRVNEKLAETIESKSLLALGLYIEWSLKSTERQQSVSDISGDHDIKVEACLMQSDIETVLSLIEITTETGMEEERIFAALNHFQRQNLIGNFRVGTDKKVAFSLRTAAFRSYLKKVVCP